MSYRNKKIFIFAVIFATASVAVIYYATPYKYFSAKFLSIFRSGNEYSRTAYSGSVKIEPTTFGKIIETLKEKGKCEEMGAANSGARCYYAKRSFKSKDYLAIYPDGPGWGPVSFTVSESELSFSKDIKGKPSFEKLKASVREDALFAGVKIRENSWKLESVTYPWDVLY